MGRRSTEIGNGVILAGQVGVKDHIKIGDGSIVCGQTGVTGDLPAGSFVSGPFARPHQQELRVQAVGSAEHSALSAHVLAKHEHPLVALHLLGDGGAHRFDHAHFSHCLVTKAYV